MTPTTATVPSLSTWAGTPLVIDSSVAFKWFATEEPGADEAADLLRQHQNEQVALVVPAHLPLELTNALAYRGRSLEDVEDAVSFLAKTSLLVAPIDDSLLIESVRIASAERMALYDAVFIGLAVRLGAALVTADLRQARTVSCDVRRIG
jgi:predicted nucleic acid-binding protein